MYNTNIKIYNEVYLISDDYALISIRLLKAIISHYLYGGLNDDAISRELNLEIQSQDNDDMRELKERARNHYNTP